MKALKFYGKSSKNHGFKGKPRTSHSPRLSAPSVFSFFLSILDFILQAVALHMVGKMIVISHPQFCNSPKKDIITFPIFLGQSWTLISTLCYHCNPVSRKNGLIHVDQPCINIRALRRENWIIHL